MRTSRVNMFALRVMSSSEESDGQNPSLCFPVTSDPETQAWLIQTELLSMNLGFFNWHIYRSEMWHFLFYTLRQISPKLQKILSICCQIWFYKNTDVPWSPLIYYGLLENLWTLDLAFLQTNLHVFQFVGRTCLKCRIQLCCWEKWGCTISKNIR